MNNTDYKLIIRALKIFKEDNCVDLRQEKEVEKVIEKVKKEKHLLRLKSYETDYKDEENKRGRKMKTKQKKIERILYYLWGYYNILIDEGMEENAEEVEKFITELEETM